MERPATGYAVLRKIKNAYNKKNIDLYAYHEENGENYLNIGYSVFFT